MIDRVWLDASKAFAHGLVQVFRARGLHASNAILYNHESPRRPRFLAVEAGTVRLVGTDHDVIVREVTRLLEDEQHHAAMAQAVNPYGDGHAAARSVRAVEAFFGLEPPPDEFVLA